MVDHQHARLRPRWRSCRLPMTSLLLIVALPAAAQALEDADAPAEAASAEEPAPDEEQALQVPVQVEARAIEAQPGVARYGRETIAAAPAANGHLAELLRLNPAADFAREGGLSASSAVLRPGEVSFHGQPFYQNLFLIDGADTVNDLNPGDATDIWSTPSLVAPHGGSSPQGYYVNVDLLDAVEVYDSNVPAEYGGFTGGVVASKLKRHDGEDRLEMRFGLKRDEWESFHVDATEDGEPDIAGADYYSARYIPDYFKPNMRISMRRGFGAVGVTLGVSRRRSRFMQEYEKRYHVGRREVRHIRYQDQIDNVVGRIDGSIDGNELGLSFRYAKRRHDGLTATTYDGAFEKEHDGYGATGDWTRSLGVGTLQLQFSFDRLGDSLDSDSDQFTFHEYAEGSAVESQWEGAFGDSVSAQRRFGLKPKWTATIARGGVEHAIAVGGEVRRTRSFYERPNDITFHLYWCIRDNGRNGCRDMDGDGASSAGDEYLSRISHYYAGEVELRYGELTAYVEDRIRLGRWQFNLGLRADRNSFLGNLDVAPRLSVEWDVFGGDESRLVAGANRYYGRSFLRYELNDAIYGWRDSVQYNVDGTVRREFSYDNRTGAADLKTPYSDEWMLGWTQAFEWATARLQFVAREGRDGVSRVLVDCDRNVAHAMRFNCADGMDDGKYFYANDGRSSTRSGTVELASARPLRLAGTETSFRLALGFKSSDGNRQTDDAYDERIDEDLIHYQGELIASTALPAWDFNIPFTTRLLAVTQAPAWNLTWSNFVNLRRGGTIARDTGDDCDDEDIDFCDGEYDVYADFEFDGLWTLDTRLTWRPTFFERFGGHLELQVMNVLDDAVDINHSRHSSRRRLTSGRLFTAEIGARL